MVAALLTAPVLEGEGVSFQHREGVLRVGILEREAKLSRGMLKPYSTGPNSFRMSTSIANAARPLASVTASVTFAFGPVLENVTVSPSRRAAYPRPPNVPRL